MSGSALWTTYGHFRIGDELMPGSFIGNMNITVVSGSVGRLKGSISRCEDGQVRGQEIAIAVS